MRNLPAVILLILLPWWSQAAILSVTPSPASSNMPLAQASSLTVRWTVVRDNSNFSPTVTSPQGLFTVGSTTLASNPRSLSQTRPGTGATTTFTFIETVQIPSSISYRARKSGQASFQYRRTFNDGYGAITGTVNLRIAGGLSGPLRISRVSVRFSDDSVERLVKRNSRLQAYALINFTGTGRLAAVWEVAHPGTSGDPVYTPLQLVRRQVSGGLVTLTSPALPTRASGIHYLRLRVTEPASPGAPVLRYFVLQQAATEPAPITVVSPRGTARLADVRAFRWQPVDGAAAYRLAFYRQAASHPGAMHDALHHEKPVAEQEIEPGHTRATPAPIVRRLPAGRYQWRVLALDKNGDVIARSRLHTLILP